MRVAEGAREVITRSAICVETMVVLSGSCTVVGDGVMHLLVTWAALMARKWSVLPVSVHKDYKQRQGPSVDIQC